MMNTKDKRRRTRDNEWNPDQCPIGFEDTLQPVNKPQNDEPLPEQSTEPPLLEDESLSPTNTSLPREDNRIGAMQRHYFPPDRKLSSASFQRTRDRFFHDMPLDRRLEELFEQPTTDRTPRRFGHAARPNWSAFDLLSNNSDYNMGLISIAIFVFFFVLIWLVVLAMVWRCRSKQQLEELNTTFQTHESGDPENNNVNDSYDFANDQDLVRMEFESAASPRWLDFPKTKTKSSKSLKSGLESFFTTDSSVDGDNQNEPKANNPSLNTSGESYTSQFYRLGLVKNGKVDVSSACDNLSATPSSHQRKTTKNISDKIPWELILGEIYTEWVNKHTGNNSPLGNDILRDLEELEEKMEDTNFSTRTENANTEQDLNASTISSLVTTAMKQKKQENLLAEEGVEIWYDVSTQSFFRIEHTQTQPSDDPSSSNRSEHPNMGSRRLRIFDICPWSTAIFQYRNLMPSSGSDTDSYGESKKAILQRRRRLAQPQPPGFWGKVGIAAFFVAGAVVLVSSFSMTIFGANKLADATNQASQFVDDAQALAMEGNTLVDNFLTASPFSSVTNNSSNIVYGEGVLLATFEDLTQQLYKTTNTYCDFGNQDRGVDEALNSIATIFDEHMAAPSVRYDDIDTDILNELEELHSDLAMVTDTTAALQDSWISPVYNVIVGLRIANALLCISCLAVLVGAFKQSLGHPAYRWIVIPLFTILVVMSFMACLAFLMGSTLLQDFCLAGPDEQLLEFLSSTTTQQPLEQTVAPVQQPSEFEPWIDMLDDFLNNIVDSEDSPAGDEVRSILSYEIAKEYIQQCPSGGAEGAPTGVVTILERGWEFTRALWEVSVLLTNTGTCVNERSPVLEDENVRSPILEIGVLAMEASCDFSVFLTGIVEVFQCDQWYDLYQEGFHQAACELGKSGLLWVAATQFVIVVFSLIMLTIRVIASPGYVYVEDKNAPEGGDSLRNSTMLIEDEEQFLNGEARGSSSSPSRPEPSKFLSKLSYCQFRKEESKLTAMANNPQEGRSSERVLRKNPQLEKKKPANNYLASTSLYSMGGANFEASHEYESDDDDENIEVCLHPGKILDDDKENRLQRLNCLSQRNRSDLTTTILSDRPRSSTNREPKSKYTSSANGWSASSDEYKSEFERVTDRLKSMNWRENSREDSLMKNQEYHRQRSAPEFLVTVTTNDGNESNAPWWKEDE